MTVTALAARIRRLEDLSVGLARELIRVQEANDPLLYLKRRAYLQALRDVLAGVEGARVVLALARQRLEAGGRTRNRKCRGS